MERIKTPISFGDNGESPGDDIGRTARGRAVLGLQQAHNQRLRYVHDPEKYFRNEAEVATRRSELRDLLVAEEGGFSDQFSAEPSQDQAGLIAESLRFSSRFDNPALWTDIKSFKMTHPDADVTCMPTFKRLNTCWGTLYSEPPSNN